MPSKTDFNVSPYYDDFNESKDFHRVMYRPAFAVQARELTATQSLLQNQLEKMGDHLFKHGAMVIPGQISTDLNYYAVKLTSFTGTLANYDGNTLTGNSSAAVAEIMDHVAPDGPVYQAGTLSGNPLAMVAGLSVLERLNDDVYSKLEGISSKIHEGFQLNISKTGVMANIARVGSMMTLFFSDLDSVKNYSEAKKCNTTLYSKYFKSMLELGVYLPPSQFECLFLSNRIDENDIDKIIDSNLKSLKKIK